MIIINVLGLVLIAMIIWWFWLYTPAEINAKDGPVVITVNSGVYQPSRIRLSAGKASSIQFLRKDESPCSAIVQFPDFGINEELPMNQLKTVELPPMEKGVHPFHCQMQMYRGALLVE